MIDLNNSIHERNRGVELLLHREKTKREQNKSKKFSLKKKFSILRWEFNFQIEFFIKRKTNISGEKRC